MKKSLTILAATFLFAACSKNKDVQTNTVQKRLTKISRSNNPLPDIYQYDEKGPVIVAENDNNKYSMNYETPGTVVIERVNKSTNVVNLVWQCKLNSKGWVEGAYIFTNSGVSSKLFSYNNDGYLEKTIDIKDNGLQIMIENFYEGGNMTKQKVYYNNVLDKIWEITYTDIPVKSHYFSVSGLPTYAGPLEGKPVKNLMKEIKIYEANNNLASHYVNDYVLDADGYPVSQVYKDVLLGTQIDYTFEYAK